MREYEYLDQVKNMIRESEEETAKRALEFNIFHTLHANDKEVMMCRMLYEFLNPKGSHGRGAEYLRCFLENILELDDIAVDEPGQAKVFREYVIGDTDRRIDIYIDTPYRAIPVEVKIYAKEQNNQCLDYYAYAAEENRKKWTKRKWRMAYLTQYGTMPSPYSTGNDKNCIDSIKAISWSVHILDWMKRIRQSQESNANVNEVITQYIGAIEEFTNQKKGLVYKKMENTGLLDGRENMKAAQAISEGFTIRKRQLMKELFHAVQERVKKEVFPGGKADKISLDPWNEQQDSIHTFYQSQKSTYPGLNYLMKEFSVQGREENYQIWLRFEIDAKPFVGFVLVKKYTDEHGKIQYTGKYERTDEICKATESFLSDISREKIKENLREDWWIEWFYVPTGSVEAEDSVPDFKACNEAYFNLYEKNQFDSFVDSAVIGIKKMRDRIKDA